MRRPPPQGFQIRFARRLNVVVGDRAEWDQVDGLYLDQARADAIASTDSDAGTLPQSERDADVSGHDALAQLRTELHETIVPVPGFSRPGRVASAIVGGQRAAREQMATAAVDEELGAGG